MIIDKNMRNIFLITASIFLFLALFNGWSYDFFTILRFVVFISTVYSAWSFAQINKTSIAFILGAIAVLFNPFFPIGLSRDVWVVIDALVGVLLLVLVFKKN